MINPIGIEKKINKMDVKILSVEILQKKFSWLQRNIWPMESNYEYAEVKVEVDGKDIVLKMYVDDLVSEFDFLWHLEIKLTELKDKRTFDYKSMVGKEFKFKENSAGSMEREGKYE